MKKFHPRPISLAAAAAVGALAKNAPEAAQTHIFCQLVKVDTVNRVVYGRAVQEVPDASGEIFDYESSKPFFEKWVNDTKEATHGKSLGNIRAMHGNIAAGKMVEIEYQDDEKAIDIAAKIVDDNEWAKVQEGVYTGFSIGGVYVGEKTQEGTLQRYTAAPIEISLVDKPCIPTAMFFDIVKAKGFEVVGDGGAVTKQEFKLEVAAPEAAATGGDDEPAQELEIEGAPEDVAALQAAMQSNKLNLAAVVKMVKASVVDKRFADEANKKYPLDNGPQVIAAWQFVNTAKAAETYSESDLAAIKARVAEAYVERFGSDPSALTADEATKALSSEELTKSFWSVSDAASMLSSLSYFIENMRYYEEVGSAPAGVCGKITVAIQAMGEVMSILLASAISEMGSEEAESDTAKMLKAQLSTLEKAGARNAKADMERIQKGHDLMVELGAACKVSEEDPEGSTSDDAEKMLKALGVTKDQLGELLKATGELAKVRTELDALKARPQPARVILKAVTKEGDNPNAPETVPPVEAITDRNGQIDAAATLIKLLHRGGQAPQ